MTNKIHPSAIIDDTVKLGDNNIIGPYCIITGNVEIGNNNILQSHVIMHGNGLVKIGDNNQFFPFVSLHLPQDKKYHGELSELHIGNNNIFREYVTANPGTKDGIMKTVIGNDCLFLMSSHVAHDCIVGNGVIFSNNVAIAGHVEVGDYAILGGLSAVHQYSKIGEYSMVGGLSAVSGDVIPYGVVVGQRANLAGLNIIGLKRKGFSKEEIRDLRNIYEYIFKIDDDVTFLEKITIAKEKYSNSTYSIKLIDFIKDNMDGSRSLCKPR
jgi:UDP-N-acetylglucosamine acyltransferase